MVEVIIGYLQYNYAYNITHVYNTTMHVHLTCSFHNKGIQTAFQYFI